MKKPAHAHDEAITLSAERTKDNRPADTGTGKEPGKEPSRNIYTEIIHSLMDKNRKRVAMYYCANSRCATTFFDAAAGYQCPGCGSIGIISEYRHDTSRQDDVSRPVLGYLDTIGRLFCTGCTHRHGLADEVSMVVYSDSEPYRNDHCDVCRMRLSEQNRQTD